jgi:hypothetical protein
MDSEPFLWVGKLSDFFSSSRKHFMNNIDEIYAVSFLKSWFEKNDDFFKNNDAASEFKDSGHGSANVRLETARHLIEVSAWDHASCLDIQILEVKSEESTFPHMRECETKSVFECHLQDFIQWFKDEYEPNA